MPAQQKNREIAVSGPLGDDALLFHRMRGTEKLGYLFEYQLELLSERTDIHIKDVLGKSLSIRLALPNAKERYFNGIVTRFCLTGQRGRYATYAATLRPWTWLLSRSSNCRIFQDKSVVDIIKEICHGPVYAALIDLDDGCLSRAYEVLPYCVQYRETDFNFISRLMEQEGIYYFFKHDASRHTMVLADSYGAHQAIPGYAAVEYKADGNHTANGGEGVYAWSAGGEIQPSKYALNDFYFERTAASTSGGLLVNATLKTGFEQTFYEMFDYPGGYAKTKQGEDYARARIESYHGQCEQIEAHTTARGLYPGGLFGLIHHPRADQNRDYLVTAAHYELLSDDYVSNAEDAAARHFTCDFAAIGKEHNYRPERVVRKPVVQGPQTAIVVGTAGEEIYTDKYGRVKVQFHWDRLGKADEKSSCWIRVSQSWAGNRWGALFIPRIGQEVIVDFLEGDPDRPLVTGSVYNSDTMPPYPLPENATRSAIKSNSSKGGAGFNELRFEDKKDKEEFFVQAERDFNRVVKNNDTLRVGFHKKSPGDQTIEIKNDQKVDVGNHQKVQVGKSCVIEAATAIELKVGGSSIKIEPEKITIKSAMVVIDGSANVEVKSGATMKIDSGAMMAVKSGAIMTVEGALVKIN